MKKIAAYYRSSTDLQENSIEMQRIKAIDYSIKNRIPIHEEYIDKDVSARKNTIRQRPNMKKLLQEIEAGVVGELIVYKRDRLARNVKEHMELYHLFEKHNVKVHFSSDGEVQMYYSPIGEYLESILGAICEHEGSQIAQRIRETKIAKFLAGKSAGNLPFGYKYGEKTKEGKITIHKQEKAIEIVKKIFSDILSDKYANLTVLCNVLNNQGLKQNGVDWNSAKIVKTVSNPLYAGTRIVNFGNKKHKKAYVDLSIVTEEEWDLANKKLEKMIHKREYTKEEFRFPLKRILLCSFCRKPLETRKRMKNYKNYDVYECKEHDVCIDARVIEVDLLHHSNQFFTRLASGKFEELYERNQKHNVEKILKLIQRQKQTVEKIENKLEIQMDLWLKKKAESHQENAKIKNEEVKKEKNKLQQLQMRLHEIKNFKERAKKWLGDLELRDEIAILPDVEREQFYKDMIHAVYVNCFEYHIIFKHPFMSIQEVHIEDV